VQKALGAMCVVAILFSEGAEAQNWKMQPLQIQTRWAADVNPSNALPDYPRPQMMRGRWQTLNGLWNYAITAKDTVLPSQYAGTILVPYPLESALSGVRKSLKPTQLLWYRRAIMLRPEEALGKRTLLHFGAVDYQASVYVNGFEVGSHTGGYQSFTFDITNQLKSGNNELIVKVSDPTDTGSNPHGKQSLDPREIFYTSSSGIWQTVWLETVPQTYVASLTMTPDVDHELLYLRVSLGGPINGYVTQATVMEGLSIVSRVDSKIVNGCITLPIRHPRLWSPGNPFLYDLKVRLLKGDRIVDEVKSYFGMRKVEVKKDPQGMERIFLNGRYTYNLGTLDQGFWPDGLYTAPTDAALKFDIQAIKAMGFNTIRKHIKVEPDRWYYYCDKLGMLVWQDMVPPGNSTTEARVEFEKEVKENLAQLNNHPSIVTWVLFNEGWGAYNQKRLAQWIKSLDPTRLLDAHSGPNVSHLSEWERRLDPSTLVRVMNGDIEPVVNELHQGGFEPTNWVGSDLTDIHVYPNPEIPPAEVGQARVLGEHGGIGVQVERHAWNDIAGMGYVQVKPDQFARAYAAMVDRLKLLEACGLSASIYTQPFDVEQEQNGLMTYDRAVIKIPVDQLARVNAKMVPRARNYAAVTRGFSAQKVGVPPDAQRYAALVAEYRKGDRGQSFLRDLIVVALRQGDQRLATETGNEFIDRMPRPYSQSDWAFIQAITRTSRDKGFELLRSQPQKADAALGENVAEKTVRDVIGREEIQPYISQGGRGPDWSVLESAIIAKYGQLGAEKVYGAEMLDYLNKQEWADFGKYYVLYFKTALTRSEYSITDLSYNLFKHVSDSAVLETAVKVCRTSVDSGERRGQSDPTKIDTYANLLYKVGRYGEAIEWEEKAARLSEGHNHDIVDHLKKMKLGEPTWSAG
jgi:Glycosyl hydrolases family 2, sugar binding domain/Glycosyl hydrolases family 2/Glycosyl hydrolases family 2, TIM barrel domain